MVAMAPALLAPVQVHGASFILKELQPSADRLDLQSTRGDALTLAEVVEDMAQLTAWAQLRGCARFGAATPDALMAFGAQTGWQAPLARAAQAAGEQNLTQWQDFRHEHLQRGLARGKETSPAKANGKKKPGKKRTGKAGR
jgi:uncharacterized protein (DUF2252 family)